MNNNTFVCRYIVKSGAWVMRDINRWDKYLSKLVLKSLKRSKVLVRPKVEISVSIDNSSHYYTYIVITIKRSL